MLKYKAIIVTLGFSLLANCQTIAQERLSPSPPRATAALALEDVDYTFSPTKLAAAKDPFFFFRSFVDYFYLLVQKNENQLNAGKLKSYTGWCVGDAHPENFGLLQLRDGSHIFTMNDMDDAGPCPVYYDLFRLASAAQLYSPTIDIQQILLAYTKGLSGQPLAPPEILSTMSTKALKRGQAPDPKKLSGNKFNPSLGQTPDQTTLQEINAAALRIVPNALVLDILETSKVGGGSGGSVRFEVLLRANAQLLHLEFKQQLKPSIYPVMTQPLDTTPVRLEKTLMIEQGPGHSLLYSYAQIQNRDMLVRPRFWGDEGISLSKNTDAENEQMIYFEAYVLGQIHRKTVSNLAPYIQELTTLAPALLMQDVAAMTMQIQKRFKNP